MVIKSNYNEWDRKSWIILCVLNIWNILSLNDNTVKLRTTHWMNSLKMCVYRVKKWSLEQILKNIFACLLEFVLSFNGGVNAEVGLCFCRLEAQRFKTVTLFSFTVTWVWQKKNSCVFMDCMCNVCGGTVVGESTSLRSDFWNKF